MAKLVLGTGVLLVVLGAFLIHGGLGLISIGLLFILTLVAYNIVNATR